MNNLKHLDIIHVPSLQYDSMLHVVYNIGGTLKIVPIHYLPNPEEAKVDFRSVAFLEGRCYAKLGVLENL
jgi:hypothetical protein